MSDQGVGRGDGIGVDCPAKINFALSVGPPDARRGGLHPIASWMAAINLSDRLELTPADATTFDIHFEDTSRTVDWPLEKDLAFRAHQLMEAKAGRALRVHVSLRKRIPTGAGLGGGSSDAAGVLVGLNRLFKLDIDAPSLCELGGQLGSDVTFLVGALTGSPSALVTGFGETLEPLAIAAPVPLVLIFPPFGCPTGGVFGAFDRLHPDASLPRESAVRKLAAESPLPQGGPFNDLAAPACEIEPRLAAAQQAARDALQLPVHITGSGSTLYVVAPSALTSKVIARKTESLTGMRALATRTL